MTNRLINGQADLAEGVGWLRAHHPAFAAAPDPPLRRRPGGFAALLRIVMGQQLSVASAEAIWARLEAAGGDSPAGVAAMDDAALRACGLSAQKMRYCRAIAEADLDFDALRAAPEAEAVAALTAIKGVGAWTAEIYLMFCVGRADVFAPGDLALQEGARLLLGLEARPGPKAMAQIAAQWSPWRAVAARMLWAHYARCKSREGIAP